VALPFEEVGAAALADALSLLPQWLGGQRRGHEWVGERKANGGPGDSWSVNLNTGVWANFSGSERGSDLTSLYAALNHISQAAAVKQLASMVGVTEGRQAPKLPRAAPPESPCEPIPDDAPDLKAHTEHGVASAVYRYGRAFWIARYDTPKGKVFSQHTWRNGKWWAKGYTGLKPLYHAELLPKHPEAPVLIVEGEKCVDAAGILRKYIAMTWAGGSNAVDTADWSVLAARDVIIWPDADDPGRAAAAKIAAILEPIAKRVRVIAPNGQSPGWDIADAVAEGMDRHAIARWAGEHITDKITPPAPDAEAELPPETKAATQEPSTPVAAAAESAPEKEAQEYLPAESRGEVHAYLSADDSSGMVRWSSLNLEMNQGGLPYPTLSNASQIMRAHPRLSAKIWFDTFQQKIWHTMHGVKREWTDADSADLTVFIQQSLKLNKFTLDLVTKAVEHAARRNSRNSLTDWLSSLEWDGKPRLDDWLHDCLGVDRSPYSIAVGNNWPVSMVARAFVPGEKADHMPVLEGKMGRGKSSFLEILGGEWYEALTTAIGDKDFVQSLQGIWLVEIPDMAGFGRREHSLIISTITIRRDRYRASYGRYVENHPRGCILTATSETSDYLKTGNGRRRFWPLWCSSIDLEALHAQREQVFAEAVAKYRAGASWHEMPEGTEDEQTARIEPDLWNEKILNYAAYIWDQSVGRTMQITSERLLKEAIDLDLKEIGQVEKNRVNAIMRDADWIQLRTGTTRYWKKIERRG
jgi:putative DNA primase/helicase